MRALAVIVFLSTLVLSGPVSVADDDVLPDAAQVMVRRSPGLARALRAAIGPVPKATSTLDRLPPIAVILDVTPYTAKAAPDIAKAFAELDETFGLRAKWHFARLGEKTWTPVPQPSLLGELLMSGVATDTDEVATIPALRRTLRSFPAARGGVVVYLADWRFEDDVELEAFIKALRRRDQRFSVVGSEACFGRAWNDGFYPPDRGRDAFGITKLYADAVGRSPFGPEDDERPWHGGDTAWPHVPFHYRGHWSTKFPVMLAPPPERTVERPDRYGNEGAKKSETEKDGTPEDLTDRVAEKNAEDALERYWFPLPSAFGSYPLMRAAAATGGRYVLWSWNPSGRSDVEYDYSRCNLFSPDLRRRKDIHADVRERPIARAILRAWHTVGNDEVRAADVTAPLEENARTPVAMQEADGWCPSGGWDNVEQWRDFLKKTPPFLRSLDRAIGILKKATATPASDASDRRYEADAWLFLHTLMVLRFQAGEMLAAAKQVDPNTAWDNLPLHPTLDTRVFIPSGKDPDSVVPRDVEIDDEKRGAELVEARTRFLERFQKTPFGELVGRNRVNTYRVTFVGYASGQPTKTSPSESSGKGPVTAPPSGGSGPATGGSGR